MKLANLKSPGMWYGDETYEGVKIIGYCQAQVLSKIQVQNPGPKSKVQRKRNGTGADNIILQATTTPPHHHQP